MDIPTRERNFMRVVLTTYWGVIVATFMVLAILLDKDEATGLIIFICGMLSFIILIGIKITWKYHAHIPSTPRVRTSGDNPSTIQIPTQSEITRPVEVNQQRIGRSPQNPNNVVDGTIRQQFILSPIHLADPDIDPPNYQSISFKAPSIEDDAPPPSYSDAMKLKPK